MLTITTFADRDALMAAAAERLADVLRNAIKTRGSACAALSGGATPAPAYTRLAAMDLDWPKITFALVDERFVPPTHEASNERLLRNALGPAFAKGAHFMPMYVAMPTAAQAAMRASVLYDGQTLDVALMGMGEDGHTASWFPGAGGLGEALAANAASTVVATHAPQAAGAPDRLTLTRAALRKAQRVVLLITGDPKRRALETALSGPVEVAPVAALFDSDAPAPEVLWAP